MERGKARDNFLDSDLGDMGPARYEGGDARQTSLSNLTEERKGSGQYLEREVKLKSLLLVF